MLRQFRPALSLLLLLSVFTGLLYPGVITSCAQLLFPKQANGSLVYADGKLRGSEWIGQSFTDPGYFWGRPSATSGRPYNAEASGASNLGPTNPQLLEKVRTRIEHLSETNPGHVGPWPCDLVTASASGLDPHISPEAAYDQVQRIALARGLEQERLRQLVQAHTEQPTWGIFGLARVNVLKLNLALRQEVEKNLAKTRQ